MPETAPLAPTAGLAQLARHVDAACRAPMDEMSGRMAVAFAAVAGDRGLVPPAARVSDSLRYNRHLLHADPAGRFAIVSLVWGCGQFSPVHGHHTWCAYTVFEGPLTETSFSYDAVARVAFTEGSERLAAGTTRFAFAGLDAIHKLGNGGDNVALSIHVYGLDGARIGTHVNRVVPVGEAVSA
jgi:predicted metal-dependent enzyme (double-stranded beta helix superfamily)